MSGVECEGWGFPLNSRKAHYFEGMFSLCGKWMFTGPLEPDDSRSPDDCVLCRKKLDKRREVNRD